MAIKPTAKPKIAFDTVTLPNAGTTNKMQPRLTWQNTGFDLGDNATAQEFNWLFSNNYDWISYFETVTDDHETRIGTIETELSSTVMKEGENISLLNNDSDYRTGAQVSSAIAAALDLYEDAKEPVGTVLYLHSTVDPNTYKRGTWVKTAEGQFVVGISTTDTDFDTIGETGGNKAHTHGVPYDNWSHSDVRPSSVDSGKVIVGSGSNEAAEILESIARSEANNITTVTSNVPPYQVLAIWRKTAL